MHSFRRAFLVLGFVFAGTGILRAQGVEEAPAIIILKDIPYCTGRDADPERNKLDLYLPKGRKDFPVLFWVHGGALRKGDRNDAKPLGETFAKQGVGVVTTGYRLSPAVKHPAHIVDVKDRDHGSILREISKPGDSTATAMLEFIRKHSKESPAWRPGRSRESWAAPDPLVAITRHGSGPNHVQERAAKQAARLGL